MYHSLNIRPNKVEQQQLNHIRIRSMILLLRSEALPHSESSAVLFMSDKKFCSKELVILAVVVPKVFPATAEPQWNSFPN